MTKKPFLSPEPEAPAVTPPTEPVSASPTSKQAPVAVGVCPTCGTKVQCAVAPAV
jgi:hypothetical protein